MVMGDIRDRKTKMEGNNDNWKLEKTETEKKRKAVRSIREISTTTNSNTSSSSSSISCCCS